MKLIFLTVFIFLLFSSGSCEHESEQSFIIQNNSDQEIVVIYGSFHIENECIKPTTDVEYENFIYFRAIRPHSNKNVGTIAKWITTTPDTTYIYAYHRIDMDTMSCEEFKQKYPIKKVWKITKADAEASNWTITYP